MNALNVTRRIRRAVWTLLALCLPVLLHAQPYEVSKFISSGEQAYLEVKVDGTLQKIYTEHHADYKALFVLGEGDNPELLKFSYIDSSKKIVTSILELRTEKGKVSPGRRVAGNEFIQSLKSDADGFKDWQWRFSSFPEQTTDHMVLTDAAFENPVGMEIVDGDKIVFRVRSWFCKCRNGAIAAECIISAARCVMDNLCDVWGCIERGDWTPECHNSLEEAKACAGELEQ